MNIRQLEVFKAVMNAGSTIAAGTVLAMSQSAISRQLAALEAEIGIELFEREKGRLRPTPEATAFLPEASELIERLAQVRRRVEDLRAGATGETLLKVAFPHSLASTLLPPIVCEFCIGRPDLTLEVLAGPYDVIGQQVADRVADLGFCRMPAEEPGLLTSRVLASPMVCVLPLGHDLARFESVQTCQLAGVDLVLTGRQRTSRRILESSLHLHGGSLRCRIETHSVETACGFVAAGLGVAIVPELIARLFATGPLVMRPLLPRIDNEYGIATKQGAPLSRTATAFIALLRQRLLAEQAATDDRKVNACSVP